MRALVLGGGGITGIAWELGLLAGLRRRGTDLAKADLVIGTSAGAYVGALLATGVDLDEAAAAAARIDIELSPRMDRTSPASPSSSRRTNGPARPA